MNDENQTKRPCGSFMVCPPKDELFVSSPSHLPITNNNNRLKESLYPQSLKRRCESPWSVHKTIFEPKKMKLVSQNCDYSTQGQMNRETDDYFTTTDEDFGQQIQFSPNASLKTKTSESHIVLNPANHSKGPGRSLMEAFKIMEGMEIEEDRTSPGDFEKLAKNRGYLLGSPTSNRNAENGFKSIVLNKVSNQQRSEFRSGSEQPQRKTKEMHRTASFKEIPFFPGFKLLPQ